MLRYKIRDLLLRRGIHELYQWCVNECGLSSNRASQIRNNKVKQLRYDELTALCVRLNCTPNDLLHFDNRVLKLPPEHPLCNLIPTATESNLQKLLMQSETQTKEEILLLLQQKQESKAGARH